MEDIVDRLRVLNFMGPWQEAADEIERLREKCKNIMLLLKDCDEHLDYCGYGDSWERSMAYEKDLPNRLEAALKEIA
jgi:hypothetical protein